MKNKFSIKDIKPGVMIKVGDHVYLMITSYPTPHTYNGSFFVDTRVYGNGKNYGYQYWLDDILRPLNSGVHTII